MPVLFPRGDHEFRAYLEGLVRQHHVDIQRLLGRQPTPGMMQGGTNPAPAVTTPPDFGSGGTADVLGRLSGHVAGGATTTVTVCDEAWAATVETKTGVENAFPYYLLNVAAGTKVRLRRDGTSTWRIVWCEHGPQYRGTIVATLNKGASGTVTLLVPGTDTSSGVTVSAANRYGNVTVPSGTKKVGVIHDGGGYYLDAAECG